MTSTALIVFGLVTLLGVVSLLPPLAAKLKLPYSVLLALAGCALGLLIQIQPQAQNVVAADLLIALQQFEISAEAIIIIFLPALLFEAALAVDLRGLLDDIAPILTMAVVAVVICTFVNTDANVVFSIANLPDSIFEKSRMSLITIRRASAELIAVSRYSRRSESTSVPSESSSMPMTPFIGVRIS